MRDEGPLSDRERQQSARYAEARVRRLYAADARVLESSAEFRRWLGKYAAPLLMLDLRTTNGGDLQHFMGRRSLVLEMLAELDGLEPGAYERILTARRAVENELRAPPAEEKPDAG